VLDLRLAKGNAQVKVVSGTGKSIPTQEDGPVPMQGDLLA